MEIGQKTLQEVSKASSQAVDVAIEKGKEVIVQAAPIAKELAKKATKTIVREGVKSLLDG